MQIGPLVCTSTIIFIENEKKKKYTSACIKTQLYSFPNYKSRCCQRLYNTN